MVCVSVVRYPESIRSIIRLLFAFDFHVSPDTAFHTAFSCFQRAVAQLVPTRHRGRPPLQLFFNASPPHMNTPRLPICSKKNHGQAPEIMIYAGLLKNDDKAHHPTQLRTNLLELYPRPCVVLA